MGVMYGGLRHLDLSCGPLWGRTNALAERDESYKKSSPETAFLPTPAPRYRCPHCFRQYVKWSQCQQHTAMDKDCQNGIQSRPTWRDANLQDLCRIVSTEPDPREPSPTGPVFQLGYRRL